MATSLSIDFAHLCWDCRHCSEMCQARGTYTRDNQTGGRRSTRWIQGRTHHSACPPRSPCTCTARQSVENNPRLGKQKRQTNNIFHERVFFYKGRLHFGRTMWIFSDPSSFLNFANDTSKTNPMDAARNLVWNTVYVCCKNTHGFASCVLTDCPIYEAVARQTSVGSCVQVRTFNAVFTSTIKEKEKLKLFWEAKDKRKFCAIPIQDFSLLQCVVSYELPRALAQGSLLTLAHMWHLAGITCFSSSVAITSAKGRASRGILLGLKVMVLSSGIPWALMWSQQWTPQAPQEIQRLFWLLCPQSALWSEKRRYSPGMNLNFVHSVVSVQGVLHKRLSTECHPDLASLQTKDYIVDEQQLLCVFAMPWNQVCFWEFAFPLSRLLQVKKRPRRDWPPGIWPVPSCRLWQDALPSGGTRFLLLSRSLVCVVCGQNDILFNSRPCFIVFNYWMHVSKAGLNQWHIRFSLVSAMVSIPFFETRDADLPNWSAGKPMCDRNLAVTQSCRGNWRRFVTWVERRSADWSGADSRVRSTATLPRRRSRPRAFLWWWRLDTDCTVRSACIPPANIEAIQQDICARQTGDARKQETKRMKNIKTTFSYFAFLRPMFSVLCLFFTSDQVQFSKKSFTWCVPEICQVDQLPLSNPAHWD